MNVLFSSKSEKTASITAKIKKKIGETVCLVEDSNKRLHRVESDGTYKVGNTVKVKEGTILCRTKKISKIESAIV